jgi:diacylglycerol kinase (ATP)
MTTKIIFNPYAGRWKAKQELPQVEATLQAHHIAYDLALTNGPGHATQLAIEAARAGFQPIVAGGGDGTISEVVNGLWQAATPDAVIGPLGLLPLGSANDLAHNLGLPTELNAAIQLLADGNTRRVDIGQVVFGSPAHQRCFDNNAAIGLEPTTTLIQARMRHLRGALRYLVAALRAIHAGTYWIAHLAWEGGEYHGPISLVTVGNGAMTGGLFYMTPHANPADGMLTFAYGYLPRRRDLLRLLPATMKPGQGNYVEHPAIHEIHSPWLRIRTESPTPLHADGEIQSEGVQEIEFRILPGRLAIIAQKP